MIEDKVVPPDIEHNAPPWLCLTGPRARPLRLPGREETKDDDDAER
jgi:hypothetical protein